MHKMKNIKQLPRSVHSSLHSSVFLFDLPRVVEELVFNSVDAGATKVYVSMSIGSCSVKVEDDGCGITRDGLVLLGEKNATSKLNPLTDMETNIESLGFRGEALGSLSDVSLVEVRTKARGKPNAYCKIIKGWKCLFLGIDDQRESVGTTVVVRDLFYNQPVRRKYMHSSPKSVLHSVKKCVFRTALVHPWVLFKVADVEREEELLHTIPSSSPLHLVSDGFGNKVSSSLRELAFSDQRLKLSGYLSGPFDAFSMKAFQYIYINSRFVCKGPVHNLLNNLAATFQCSEVEPEVHIGKRRRSQGYPAYMLNICCPRSIYDLTFEPSKLIVEFKDWTTILSFVEQVIRKFWIDLIAQSPQGRSISGMIKRNSNCKYDQNPVENHPVTNSIETSTEAANVDCEQGNSLSGHKRKLFPELKPCQREADYTHPTNDSFQCSTHETWNSFSPKHDQIGSVKSSTKPVMPDIDSFLDKDYFLGNLSHQTVKTDQKYEKVSLACKDNFCGDGGSFNQGPSLNIANCDPHNIITVAQGGASPMPCRGGFHKLGTQSSSFVEAGPVNWAPFFHESIEGANSDSVEKCYPRFDSKDSADGHCCGEYMAFEASNFQKTDDAYRPSFNVFRKCQTTGELDLSAGNLSNPFPLDCFSEETEFSHGSKCEPRDMEWYLNSLRPISSLSLKKVCDSHAYETDGSMVFFKTDNYRDRDIIKTDKIFSTMSFTETKDDFGCSFSPKRTIRCRYNSNGISFEKLCSSGEFIAEAGWLFSDSSDLDHSDFCVKRPEQNYEVIADKLGCLDHVHVAKIRSERSSSAPPIYRERHKFSILNDYLTTGAGKELEVSYDGKTLPGNRYFLNVLEKHPNPSQPHTEMALDEVSSPLRDCNGEKQITKKVIELENNDGKEKGHDSSVCTDFVEGTGAKWRSGNSQHTVKYVKGGSCPIRYDDVNIRHQNIEHQDDILDISSGLLHLAGSSLVPEFISKECFEDPRVLLQLDKKFIPVMAHGTLVIVDQHAADERIRLEDLRQKVLLGEGKSTTYLEPEQELILPEVGLQLLQNYTDQIQNWGWLFDFQGDCSESLVKDMNLLNKRPQRITLVAVPCILGINLTDKDLLEFLEQLAETDGSSTLPPSVLRILNFKACRGAIMFGDSLLPSECSLIIEELKATSLCFQCAHGRPTTVPLLHMPSLHEQLARLEMKCGSSSETWHGLSQQRPSIKRAQQRLASAKRS